MTTVFITTTQTYTIPAGVTTLTTVDVIAGGSGRYGLGGSAGGEWRQLTGQSVTAGNGYIAHVGAGGGYLQAGGGTYWTNTSTLRAVGGGLGGTTAGGVGGTGGTGGIGNAGGSGGTGVGVFHGGSGGAGGPLGPGGAGGNASSTYNASGGGGGNGGGSAGGVSPGSNNGGAGGNNQGGTGHGNGGVNSAGVAGTNGGGGGGQGGYFGYKGGGGGAGTDLGGGHYGSGGGAGGGGLNVGPSSGGVGGLYGGGGVGGGAPGVIKLVFSTGGVTVTHGWDTNPQICLEKASRSLAALGQTSVFAYPNPQFPYWCQPVDTPFVRKQRSLPLDRDGRLPKLTQAAVTIGPVGWETSPQSQLSKSNRNLMALGQSTIFGYFDRQRLDGWSQVDAAPLKQPKLAPAAMAAAGVSLVPGAINPSAANEPLGFETSPQATTNVGWRQSSPAAMAAAGSLLVPQTVLQAFPYGSTVVVPDLPQSKRNIALPDRTIRLDEPIPTVVPQFPNGWDVVSLEPPQPKLSLAAQVASGSFLTPGAINPSAANEPLGFETSPQATTNVGWRPNAPAAVAAAGPLLTPQTILQSFPYGSTVVVPDLPQFKRNIAFPEWAGRIDKPIQAIVPQFPNGWDVVSLEPPQPKLSLAAQVASGSLLTPGAINPSAAKEPLGFETSPQAITNVGWRQSSPAAMAAAGLSLVPGVIGPSAAREPLGFETSPQALTNVGWRQNSPAAMISAGPLLTPGVIGPSAAREPLGFETSPQALTNVGWRQNSPAAMSAAGPLLASQAVIQSFPYGSTVVVPDLPQFKRNIALPEWAGRIDKPIQAIVPQFPNGWDVVSLEPPQPKLALAAQVASGLLLTPGMIGPSAARETLGFETSPQATTNVGWRPSSRASMAAAGPLLTPQTILRSFPYGSTVVVPDLPQPRFSSAAMAAAGLLLVPRPVLRSLVNGWSIALHDLQQTSVRRRFKTLDIETFTFVPPRSAIFACAIPGEAAYGRVIVGGDTAYSAVVNIVATALFTTITSELACAGSGGSYITGADISGGNALSTGSDSNVLSTGTGSVLSTGT